MQNIYTPEAGTAACPRCGLLVPGAPMLSGALTAAGLFCYCARRRLPWSELRTAAGVERHWDAAEQASA
jgi:hypothetical protein